MLFGWRIGLGSAAFVRLLLPGYLDVVTWFSSATQFTLAYQNRLSERHNLNQMKLLVALAEEASRDLDAIQEDLEDR